VARLLQKGEVYLARGWLASGGDARPDAAAKCDRQVLRYVSECKLHPTQVATIIVGG
jgi:hypothetical protein